MIIHNQLSSILKVSNKAYNNYYLIAYFYKIPYHAMDLGSMLQLSGLIQFKRLMLQKSFWVVNKENKNVIKGHFLLQKVESFPFAKQKR